MGETGTLARLVIALGLMFLLVGLLFPGADAPWVNFQAAISTEPNIPVFQDPFAANVVSDFLLPNANGSAIPLNVAAMNCPSPMSLSFFTCVDFDDANDSFLTMLTPPPLGFSRFEVALTSATGGTRTILSIEVVLRCRAMTVEASRRDLLIVIEPQGGAPSISMVPEGVNCPLSAVGEFRFLSAIYYNPAPGSAFFFDYATDLTPMEILVASIVGDINDDPIDFTFVAMKVTHSSDSPCIPADVFTNTACQIGQFITLFFRIFIFIAVAILFVLGVIFSVLVYVFTVIFALIAGFFGMAAFFFAVPGAPVEVQYIISAIFVGLLVTILYITVKLARGSEG